MACSHPDATAISFSIPADLRDHAPEAASAATICSHCLAVSPADDGDPDPDWDTVSEAMPEGDAGVAAALLLGALDSFAINRPSIQQLVRYLEAEGTDALLLVDRLIADGSVEPAVDLGRRKRNLEQLG